MRPPEKLQLLVCLVLCVREGLEIVVINRNGLLEGIEELDKTPGFSCMDILVAKLVTSRFLGSKAWSSVKRIRLLSRTDLLEDGSSKEPVLLPYKCSVSSSEGLEHWHTSSSTRRGEYWTLIHFLMVAVEEISD